MPKMEDKKRRRTTVGHDGDEEGDTEEGEQGKPHLEDLELECGKEGVRNSVAGFFLVGKSDVG